MDQEVDKEWTPFPASADIVDKIESIHAVQWYEAGQIFANKPRFTLVTASDQYGEPRYAAWGQTDGGRYLVVLFVPVEGQEAKVITAREMNDSERRRFQQR